MNAATRTKTMQHHARDVLGHRAKIGILVPPTNTIVEPELASMQPPGVTNHVSRLARVQRNAGDLEAYRALLGNPPDMTSAVDLLVACEPDIVILGHSIDSFVGRRAAAEQMRTKLQGLTGGIPVVIPSLALLAALEAMGRPRRISILTPYMPPGDEAVADFYSSSGYEVVKVKGLRHPTPLAIATADAALLNRSIDEIDGPGVDCIVKVGTNSAIARLVPDIEARIGKPVLAVNTVMYWAALRQLGIEDKLKGFGRLVETH